MIAPRAPGVVSFAEAQGMVNAIWAEMGLKYPPAVEPLPKQARTTIACATRLEILLPDNTPTWCLLHEISHAITSTNLGHSDGHGKQFMGIYVELIVRYLRLEVTALIKSINEDGIELAMEALPAFVDTQI